MSYGADIDDSEGEKFDTEETEEAKLPETLMEWTNLIQSTIRTQCGEHIEFKGVIEDDGTFRIDYDRSPDSLPCVLKAIRENIEVMHPVARSIFEKIIEDFEKPPAQSATRE